MARSTRLEIRDEVNTPCHDLDVATRRKLSDTCKYFLITHMPAYKLGWDGYVRYCDIGGRSYLNLLDLPVVAELGYEVEVDDKRQSWSFAFDKVEQDPYEQYSWSKTSSRRVIIPRDLVEIIKLSLENPMFTRDWPGARKTLVTAVLVKCEQYGRTIVIVK